MAQLEWEDISMETRRLKVYGGWLIRYTAFGSNEVSSSMCFVPDKEHEWKI